MLLSRGTFRRQMLLIQANFVKTVYPLFFFFHLEQLNSITAIILYVSTKNKAIFLSVITWATITVVFE
jgi:hypothetical protein